MTAQQAKPSSSCRYPKARTSSPCLTSDCYCAISKGAVTRGSLRAHCFPERLLNRSDPFDTNMEYRRPSRVARSTSPTRLAYLPGPGSHVEVCLGTDAMVLSAKEVSREAIIGRTVSSSGMCSLPNQRRRRSRSVSSV